MCDLVLTQTTVSDGQRALASASAVNSPAPVGRAAGFIGAGAGFGSEAWTGTGAGAGAGAAAGAGAGAAVGAGAAAAGAGAAAGAAAFCARHCARNCCQVMPLVVLLALAAFHSLPHSFMTLWARAAPVVASPMAAARRKAETASLND